jgi:cysteinyl-tRNA synthetase
MANYWLHNGFLQVEGEKMSKSLGNFVTIRDVLGAWRGTPWAGPVVRLAMMTTHYRQPLDWTIELLERSRDELAQWCRLVRMSEFGRYDPYSLDWTEGFEPPQDVVEALSDDLNFPKVHAYLRSLSSAAQRGDEEARLGLLSSLGFFGFVSKQTVGALAQIVEGNAIGEKLKKAFEFQVHVVNGSTQAISIFQDDFRKEHLSIDTLQDGAVYVTDEDAGADFIDRLVAARAEARKARNYAKADRIRDELDAMGIALKDSKDPDTGELVTTWEVKR